MEGIPIRKGGPAMDFWVDTVDPDPWRIGESAPTVLLVWRSETKLRDALTYAQALLPGQTLRIVSDRRLSARELSAVCAGNQLVVTATTEDRCLTMAGCYAHHYTELKRLPERMVSAQ